MFNVIFHNFSVISWWSVLLMEETGENHLPVASHWQTLSHNVLSGTARHERGLNLQRHWWKAPIAQVVVNPTTMTTTTPNMFDKSNNCSFCPYISKLYQLLFLFFANYYFVVYWLIDRQLNFFLNDFSFKLTHIYSV